MGVGMADTVQCPGCRAVVPVARPLGVDYRVLRESVRGQDCVTIRVGKVISASLHDLPRRRVALRGPPSQDESARRGARP